MERTTNNNDSSSSNSLYTNKTINLLADGFVQLYKPSLLKTKQQLKELTDKQNIIVEQLHHENMNLAGTLHSVDLQEIFNLIKVYNIKLQNIKKDMKSLHERSIKLKKRSLKLQQFKEKEMYIMNKLHMSSDINKQVVPSTSKNENN